MHLSCTLFCSSICLSFAEVLPDVGITKYSNMPLTHFKLLPKSITGKSDSILSAFLQKVRPDDPTRKYIYATDKEVYDVAVQVREALVNHSKFEIPTLLTSDPRGYTRKLFKCFKEQTGITKSSSVKTKESRERKEEYHLNRYQEQLQPFPTQKPVSIVMIFLLSFE